MASTAQHDADAAPPADAGLFGLPTTPDEARLVIVPVPWDATTSYRPGTSRGPAAIRVASHQLDLYDADLGEPWRAGIAMLDIPDEVARWNTSARVDAEKVIEVGGRIGDDKALAQALARVNDAGAKLNRHVYEQVDRLLAQGKLVGVLGGDHSVPFGAIARMAESHDRFGILHVDAHCDLREAYEGFEWSHASIMYNVIKKLPQVQRLVQVGIRDFAKREADFVAAASGRVVVHHDGALADRAFAGEPWRAVCDAIVRDLPEKVYVSFDIDGLDPALCPSTGTPVPGGLSFQQAAYLIKRVVETGHTIIGFDLNEVVPGPDGDEWDANVGARVLYKLCGWTLRSQK
ncbi:MAG TPA: agmatinase family protein [Kofleriaceae bacterium]|nr:agmatinase family protein [Kofleriaceae bacterium]